MKKVALNLIILFVGLFFGYCMGAYYVNYLNYMDNTSVEIDASFIRVNTSIDTLNAIDKEEYDKTRKIQHDVLCATIGNIKNSNLAEHLEDPFNQTVKNKLAEYVKKHDLPNCDLL